MLWFWALVVLVVVFLSSGTIIFFKNSKNWESIFFGSVPCILVGLIIVVIGSISVYTDSLDVSARTTKLQKSLYQRDQLVELVKTELSTDQFEDLMRATTAAEVKIIFSGSSVSQLLITRANEIVAINAKYLAQYTDIINRAIDLCNQKRNVFVPRFPGVGDCNIDLVDGLPEQVGVYNG